MKLFKMLGEKFKAAPKKEQQKIYIASLLTVLATVICVTFMFWNEICYTISPAWHLSSIAQNSLEKISDEQSYLSKRLFGFDTTKEAYRIELTADALLDGRNEKVTLSLSPGESELQIGLEADIDEVPVLQTLAVWNDRELSFSFPQINNNRYYLPADISTPEFRTGAFAKSLPFVLPAHIDSLAYSKFIQKDEATQKTAENTVKRFLKRLDYGKREKKRLVLDGNERSLHIIHAKCRASDLSECVAALSLLYTDDWLKNTEVSRMLSGLCQELKGYASQNLVYDIELMEQNSYLIGLKTNTFTVYFHDGLFLNGFNVETPGQTLSLRGDIQMQGGVLDFVLTRSTPTEQEKYFGLYLDYSARKLSVYTPMGVFETNVRCANDTETFAVYENAVYHKNRFVDFSLEVKPGKPEIAMGTTAVPLTSKSCNDWKNTLDTDIRRLLRDTSVFRYLFQK